MAEESTSHRDKTLVAGFNVVADTDGVAHLVTGSCWQEEGQKYIPFGSVEEAQQHGNVVCSKCSTGKSKEPLIVEEEIKESA